MNVSRRQIFWIGGRRKEGLRDTDTVAYPGTIDPENGVGSKQAFIWGDQPDDYVCFNPVAIENSPSNYKHPSKPSNDYNCLQMVPMGLKDCETKHNGKVKCKPGKKYGFQDMSCSWYHRVICEKRTCKPSLDFAGMAKGKEGISGCY